MRLYVCMQMLVGVVVLPPLLFAAPVSVSVLLPSILTPQPSPPPDKNHTRLFLPKVEPPHGSDPDEMEIPALREMKSSSAGPTVWSEFSALAAETGAPVNLGQVWQ